MKRILAVCYGGGHAKILRPVLDLLSKHSLGFSVVVLALTTGKSVFKNASYPVYGFSDFFDVDRDFAALEAGKRLLERHHSNHTGIPTEESLAYLGLNFTDLVAQHGAAQAYELVENEGRAAFLPLNFMDKLFAEILPDFVLTTNSPRTELAARIVAKEKSIPVMAITDLLGSHGFIPDLDVDYLCVASKTAEKQYKIAENVRADVIRLVGNPAMDYAANLKSVNKSLPTSLQKNDKWCDERKHVLVAEQYGYMHKSGEFYVEFSKDEIIQNLDATLEACKVNQAQMIVRPHPTLNPNLYIDWCNQAGSGALMGADWDLNEIFGLSDLLVSNMSTIMIDAMYRKCPVLIVNYSNSGNLVPLDKMGIAQGVMIEDQASFNAKVGNALRDKNLNEKQNIAFSKEFPQLPCSPQIVDMIASHFK